MSDGILLTDYLIPHAGIDWNGALEAWSWLLPQGDLTLWLVNRCGDLFLVYGDETVHMLDMGRGTLTQVAADRDDFALKMGDPRHASDWLLIPLINQIVAAGIVLAEGQCYGYRKLPILGGSYTVDNFAPISVADFIGGCGTLHLQLKDLPDGTEVRITPE